jgi:pyruvate dehydrogenase E2 component (dihydrolipoamide acetyltransferase)
MAEIMVMPKLGLTMKEGKVGKWLKKEGETVKKGEPLLEVATDKLTNEVEAPCDGTLLKIIGGQGVVIPCLKPIAIIGEVGEDISALELPGQTTASASNEAVPEKVITAAESKSNTAAATGRVKASPAAKKRAEEMGIAIAEVKGTGPQGRITVEDVEAHAVNEKAVKATPMAAKTAASLDVNMQAMPAKDRLMKADVVAYHEELQMARMAAPAERRESMSQMRQVISERMTASWLTSPAVTYDMKVEMTALMQLKKGLSAHKKVTVTDMLVKIAATVLMEFPLLNASIDGDELILRNYANIGVAVALEDGLIVPVVKYANVKGLGAISDEVKSLAGKAKRYALNTDDMTGGTFTISNLGMFGMDAFSPIINQPEVAILGVNAAEDVLYLSEGIVKSKSMMKLSLTADHRAVDGAVAANFLKRLKDYIENPEQLLL